MGETNQNMNNYSKGEIIILNTTKRKGKVLKLNRPKRKLPLPLVR